MEREPHGSEVSETFRLLKDVNPLRKGHVLEFFPESGVIYTAGATYPLRNGLAGYLWLMRTEPGYFRRVRR